MMRIMRKILKRKVSIVMAVLVILGIAVYGVSAFAQQAYCTTVTLDNNYVYLNPAKMTQNSIDWGSPANNGKIYLGYIPSGGSSTTWVEAVEKDDTGCWKWKIDSLTNVSKGTELFFTYVTDWNIINKSDYYRTEGYVVAESKDELKGLVFEQNGKSTKIKDTTAYALKLLTSNAGSTLTFVDMTGEKKGIKAQFSYNNDYTTEGDYTTVDLSDNKATVPNNNGIKIYQYMRFVDVDGTTLLSESVNIEEALNAGGTLYYGMKQETNATTATSEWSNSKISSTAPNITKLYFDKTSFPISEANSIKIKVGDGKETAAQVDSADKSILSYDLSGKSVAANTIITVSYNDIIYRFYPNGIRNVVKIDGDKAEINDIYRESTGTYTVYFDATLSKLQYDNRDAANNSLPRDNENIYYYAWGENLTSVGGQLQKVESVGNNTLKGDVYSADLTNKYEHILFYSANNQIIPNTNNTGVADNSSKTCDLTIPWSSVTAPCFYADTSDDSIYTAASTSIATSLRSGYWDEVGKVRDADGKKKDGTYNIYNNGTQIGIGNARQDQQVVDIPEGTLTRDSDMLYVNTTLYDYYSDYELNGYNRDNYSNTDLVTAATSNKLQFMYQPFRQFDQALSTYYSDNNATSPIYWGNFQNYDGNPYSEISNTLNLYGSDKWNEFIFNNNSMWGSNVPEMCPSPNKSGQLSNGNNATQGLVSDTLSDNNLMIKTSEGTVKAPYFDESFLAGNNSKNTVLGKVYNGVTFPFVKEKMNSKSDSSAKGTVEYWTFDSAKSAKNGNLELQHSEADGYFLNPTNNAVYGQTADKGFPDTSGQGKSGKNYFPFNNTKQSGTAAKLNYGFGQKFDLKFRLSSDGTVTTSDNEKVPIEFNFSGDDDVWVFIDGKLVLDVGGGHGKVSGTINFKDKTVTVSGIKNPTGGGADTNGTAKKFDAIKEEDNTKEHTLTMFYMERGLWESNMSISFNFPDENEFQVEKNVDTTDVAEDFKACFDNVSAFPFTILNQATHYAAKEATGGQEIKNKTFNDTFGTNTISNVGNNVFEHLETCRDEADKGTEKSDVVHWKAELSDDGTYKHLRWGIIYPSSGKGNEFNATYTIGKSTTNHYKYLQFSLYDGVVTETPSLNNMYVELEDSNNNKIGGFLSAGNTYNSLNLKKGKWNTITIDLDKLSKTTTSFDYSKIVNIKFDYNLSRDMYLDYFTFIPSSEVTQPTGFVTKQYEIPDYGSVKSGTLMYPVNAVYTVSSGASTTTNLMGADGTFTLANGETATFEDQFRRGSYIALSEDVDTEVFTPSWTLYENGEEVRDTASANPTTVTQAETVTLPTQAGQALKDGRQEIYVSGADSDGTEQSNTGYTTTGWAKKNGTTSSNTDRDEKNTIVFRSFTDPDSSTASTKLKVKYTNKVRTGAISIAKSGAYSSDTAETLDQEYQIKVTFTNIAGMALENGKTYEKIYKLKWGDKVDITGIPAGTEYTISEILPEDGSSLNDIEINQPTYTGDDSKYTASKSKDSSGNLVVHGKIKADSTAENTVFTFKNTKKPVINLTVEKKWEGTKTNTNLPDSVTVKLQRRVIATPENKWEDVPVTDSEGKETKVVTLRPDNQNTANSWKYVFKNLDRYPDYTKSQNNPYEYRVVEVVKDAETYKELSTGDYFNDCFKVQSYNSGTNVSTDSSDTSIKVDKTFTITNVYSPKTNIKITKVDASDESVKLNGVEFTLEKLKPASGTGSSFEVDSGFTTRTVTTSGTRDTAGIAEFTDLPDGRYRLTETKAKEGYSLLKDPIIIVIDRTGKTVVDNENYTFGTTDDTKNTISLQISNRMKFLLPKTGGYGAMLFILCGMALATLGCLIFFLITLRKEVQYSKLKRQRRNAIGR